MMTKKAGRFAVEVSDPHPPWVRIYVDGKEIGYFRAEEVRDLEYLLSRTLPVAEKLEAA